MDLDHHGPCVPPGVITMRGREDSKEAATVAFGKTLRAWLDHVCANTATGPEPRGRAGIG